MHEKFPLEPFFERLILKVDPIKTESSVLIMGSDVEQKSDTGVVQAVGPLVLQQTSILPGDRIKFIKFAGQTITWEGEEYLLLQANDALYKLPN